MIEGYYDKERFWHFPDDWKCLGGSKIKKTATFYGDERNFYIDSSDGVNDDLNIDELLWRIKEIVAECKGKPFIVFKTSFSKTHSRKLKDFAQEHNGDVVPFFLWSYYKDFQYLLENRDKFLEIKKNTKKEYDVGFIASLEPYYYPDGKGGKLKINTRQEMFDKLSSSNLKFFHANNLSFDDYIKASFKCKFILNAPGIGEYSGRMLETWALGQALGVRKNTYDNAISYKPHVLEIDFSDNSWEWSLQQAVDNYEYWDNLSNEYWDKVYQGGKIFNHI